MPSFTCSPAHGAKERQQLGQLDEPTCLGALVCRERFPAILLVEQCLKSPVQRLG
jgi:hypothetical protein